MAARVFRTIFHHPIQLLVLILLPVAIGGLLVYRLPRQYQGTATLVALHRYDTLTATSVDSSNLDTPAETQVTALNELLQSRSFALEVAQDANLASTLTAALRDDPPRRDDALVADISQHVQAVAQGFDLFTITYSSTDPQITRQVVEATIDGYNLQIQAIVQTEGQKLLETYQTQLAQAQKNAQSAAATESDYIQSHPQLTGNALQRDPQFIQLHAQTQQAQQDVQNVETGINTLEQDIATHAIVAASLYSVLDKPTVPTQPVSRLKNLLLGAGAGLAIGILASALLIALAVRRDRKVYTGSDLYKVTTYPVVMELPRLPPQTVSILVKTARRQHRAFSSNGRTNS